MFSVFWRIFRVCHHVSVVTVVCQFVTFSYFHFSSVPLGFAFYFSLLVFRFASSSTLVSRRSFQHSVLSTFYFASFLPLLQFSAIVSRPPFSAFGSFHFASLLLYFSSLRFSFRARSFGTRFKSFRLLFHVLYSFHVAVALFSIRCVLSYSSSLSFRVLLSHFYSISFRARIFQRSVRVLSVFFWSTFLVFIPCQLISRPLRRWFGVLSLTSTQNKSVVPKLFVGGDAGTERFQERGHEWKITNVSHQNTRKF